MYAHTQKSIENVKITFFENVKKIKNIPIKDGESPLDSDPTFSEEWNDNLLTKFKYLNIYASSAYQFLS